ncbi:SsgA family sporulation/cell division regulator [Streptomyces sp. SID2888]|uniref:SsgA family sporulation/cell division regulator n=1 Tax=Streptomyces sp. SID2888 TaxID=2690256 RepID=UPI001369452D|nr:SsgA family sporulation/cell division regulator [Streptomyces sp. SID2888]MYV48409.1 SsgA family sporulation/cell division regulator [Streptomyces sp. SID2888]
MTVRKDAITDNVAAGEDDDFDALLNASSLGSPHVLAETEPIPADIGRRLSEVAAGPTRHSVEPSAPDESDCAAVDTLGGFVTYDGCLTDLGRLKDQMHRLTYVVMMGTGSGKTSSLLSMLYLRREQPHEETGAARPNRLTPWPDKRRELTNWLWWCSTERETWARPFTRKMLTRWRDLSAASGEAAPASCSRPHTTVTRMRLLLDALTDSQAACHVSTRHQFRVHPARMTELLSFGRRSPQWAEGTAWPPHRQLITYKAESRALCTPTVFFMSPSHSDVGWMEPRGVMCGLPPAALLRNSLAAYHRLNTAQRMAGQSPIPMSLPAAPCLDSAAGGTSCCSLVPASPTVPGPEWITSLLLVSHLPTLWHPMMTQSNCIARSMAGEGAARAQPLLRESRSKPQHSRHAQRAGRLPGTTEEAENGTVNAQLQMAVHHEKGEEQGRVPVRLTYRLTEPYAVEAAFYPDGPGRPVWIFARDLLIEGLKHSAGEGDVTVWSPSGQSTTDAEGRTFIRLCSPEGTALLSASRDQLQHYVTQTQRLCPTGAEHVHLRPTLDALESELGELTCPGASD